MNNNEIFISATLKFLQSHPNIMSDFMHCLFTVRDQKLQNASKPVSQRTTNTANTNAKSKSRDSDTHTSSQNATDNLNERMESAYMGEHFNIEPDDDIPEKQPLSSQEQRFYDYIMANPTQNKRQIESGLHISQANYYYLKSQLKKKGWLSGDNILNDPIIG